MTEAVAFLLVKDNMFLAERRKKQKEAYPGMTAVPGGRMEPGETMVQTLIREIMEELSVEPIEYGYYCSLDDPEVYGGLTIHYYWVKEWKGELASNEADEIIWMDLNDAVRIEVPIDRDAVMVFMELKKKMGDRNG